MTSLLLWISRRTMLRVVVLVSLVSAFGSAPALPSGAASRHSSSMLALFQNRTSNLSWRLAALANQKLTTQRSAEQAHMLNVAEAGPGSLTVDATGAVLTSIRVADTSAATLAALQTAGAQITFIATATRTVTAYVATTSLISLAAVPQVANIKEVLRPEIGSAQYQPNTASAQQTSCAPGIVSEGDQQLRAADGRAAFAIDGAGVTVGVLSDSFDRSIATPTTAAQDIVNGDLPGAANPCGRLLPVQVLKDLGTQRNTTATDEGRAMLHIVHDLAPGAMLSFASALGGEDAFAASIRALHQAGANILVDDVRYPTEPFYQDGPVSVAIDDVTANGALSFTAVGNSRVIDANGNEIGSYEASYRATRCPFTSAGTLGSDCHSFSPIGSDPTFGITLAAGASFNMVFQWAQPRYGVESDFDIFLVDDYNNVVAGSADRNTGSNGTQFPVEFLQYQNRTRQTQVVNLVIARFEGPAVPLHKFVIIRSAGIIATEYNRTNSTDAFGATVFGHGAANTTLAIAAVPFSDKETPESFSSRGSATLYFGPVASAEPAALLASPVVRQKPDLAATDGTLNSFFGQVASGGYRFFGTSAAAPHGAAVAALLRQRATQRNVAFRQSIVESVLKTTAAAMTNGTPVSVGAGRIDAVRALDALEQLTPLVPVQYLPLIVK